MSPSRKTRDGTIAPPLPQNLDAERSVLGSILLDNSYLSVAAERLKPTEFFSPQHHHIFDAMLGMGARNIPIDLVTLTDELRNSGDLEAAGGAAYLAQLVDGVPRVSNVGHYARIVKEKANLRAIIHAMDDAQKRAVAGEEESGDILGRHRLALCQIDAQPNADDTFHAREEYMNAPQLRFAIQNLVQADAATIFGGLSGQSKTWILLSIGKALLEGAGTRLWNYFHVNETAEKVVYLIPESTIGPFGHRLKLFGLITFVEQGKLLTRTLSKGPRIELDDPRILSAAKDAHVFLDTIGRWSEGDENSAGDNQRGLASDIFGLLGAGARSVIAAHHSPKGFSKETVMSLENCLRGSGDVGAMVGTAFGVRQIDATQNIVHVECVKPRDFEPPEPFQLIGRPFIDQEGNFRMHRKPGECGKLAEYLDADRNRGGAPDAVREARAANLELLRQWLTADPRLSSRALSERFAASNIKLGDSAIRKYRKELGTVTHL